MSVPWLLHEGTKSFQLSLYFHLLHVFYALKFFSYDRW